MSLLYPKIKANPEYITIIHVPYFIHLYLASPNLKPQRVEAGEISNLKIHLLLSKQYNTFIELFKKKMIHSYPDPRRRS